MNTASCLLTTLNVLEQLPRRLNYLFQSCGSVSSITSSTFILKGVFFGRKVLKLTDISRGISGQGH